MPKKLAIEEVKFRAKELGKWVILDDHYENKFTKLNCQCVKCGYKTQSAWQRIRRNVKCKKCNKALKLEFIRADFEKEGYILLTKVYDNNYTKLEYICPRGCRHFVTWNNWQRNRRCPCFSNNTKLDIEFIRADFKKEGYILLTKVYENNQQKLEYICPMGHRHSVSWSNWNSKNKRRCPFCSNHISKWEKEVKSFISESTIDYEPNDRTQLTNPKTGYNLELDIWFSELNKAIECNGVYWHKDRQYIDLLKKQLCKDQGIDLLVITDEGWKDDIDKCKAKLISFVKGRTKTCHITE